jgi:riboflavin transporter FmnP
MEITEEVVVVKFRELIKNMAISLKSNVKQMIIRSIITAVIVMVLNLIVQLIPAYEGSYLMHLRTSSLSWGALTGLVLSLVSTVKVEGVSTLLRSVRPAFNGMMNFTKNEHKGFFGVGIVGAIILTFILNDPTFALSFGVVGFLSIGRQNN